ncbi:hypothetical protein TeGR_g11706 [Tetraparma gracilis]|uniref:Uncharacterized protein n=1 Tax=Tetraparma gracilis TaxID=2962635 RepID=A0ABQ6N4I2_9STRA|nr:hypothetical protein TeGR_g11706 [Tetraparma gracilis]
MAPLLASLLLLPLPAPALIPSFAPDLSSSDAFPSVPLDTSRRTSSRLAEQYELRAANAASLSSLLTRPTLPTAASAPVLSLSLYLLSGSRSTPLARPLSKLLPPSSPYRADLAAGYLASPPLPIALLLLAAYALLSLPAAALLLLLSSGDDRTCLQLSVLLLIAAGLLELARVDSRLKPSPRGEAEAAERLREEFWAFAGERLREDAEASCHREDVLRAFRRFHPQYRTGGVEDLQVERQLADWLRERGRGLSGAGFARGVRVEEDKLDSVF